MSLTGVWNNIKGWMRVKSTSSRRGSLLLEALLSITILSVSLTLVIQSMTASLRAAVYSTGYTTAIFLLEGKMVEMIQEGFVEAGQYADEAFSPPFEEYHYLMQTEAAKETGFEDLNHIHMAVSWGRENKKSKISLGTFLFRPSP